jgi:hypothetical protein
MYTLASPLSLSVAVARDTKRAPGSSNPRRTDRSGSAPVAASFSRVATHTLGIASIL